MSVAAVAPTGAPGTYELRRWARQLAQTAEMLESATASPEAVDAVRKAAKAQVDRVADEMYAAHQAAAIDAWGQALGKRVAS